MTVQVFVASAQADTALVETLAIQLAPATRCGDIAISSLLDVPPGVDRRACVQELIFQSRIVVVFLTAHFIASDDYLQILEHADLSKSAVVPVLLRACDWRQTSLRVVQPLPRDGTPLLPRDDVDSAWLEIAIELRRLARKHEPILRDANVQKASNYLLPNHPSSRPYTSAPTNEVEDLAREARPNRYHRVMTLISLAIFVIFFFALGVTTIMGYSHCGGDRIAPTGRPVK